MAPRSFPTFAGATLLAFSSVASAQFGEATFSWQLSTDDGVTWRSGDVEVAASPTRVLGRVFLSWTPDTGVHFSASYFDGVIQGARPQDRVLWADTGDLINIGRPHAHDLPGLIKFDDRRDTAFPGEGPYWYAAGNSFYTGILGGPLVIMDFELQLDGTPGRRELTQVFRPPVIGQPPNTNCFFVRYVNQQPTPNWVAARVVPASIVVVPGPATTGIVVVAGFFAGRRRRA